MRVAQPRLKRLQLRGIAAGVLGHGYHKTIGSQVFCLGLPKEVGSSPSPWGIDNDRDIAGGEGAGGDKNRQ